MPWPSNEERRPQFSMLGFSKFYVLGYCGLSETITEKYLVGKVKGGSEGIGTAEILFANKISVKQNCRRWPVKDNRAIG